MTRVVLGANVGARFDQGLDAVEMRVQGGPVERRVAGEVAVVDECGGVFFFAFLLGRFEGLEEEVEEFCMYIRLVLERRAL